MLRSSSSYYNSAFFLRAIVIIITKDALGGKSKRKITSLGYIAVTVKTGKIVHVLVGHYSNPKKTFILKSDRVAGVNPQVCRTENSSLIRHRIYPRKTGFNRFDNLSFGRGRSGYAGVSFL